MEDTRVQFICEASRYMEMKDKDVWIHFQKQIVIKKNKKKKKKEGWIENLAIEIAIATESDDVVFNETEESIIIDFFHCAHLQGIFQGEFQEQCCKALNWIAEAVKKVMKKFRIKNYSLTYIFEPYGKTAEEVERMLLEENNIVYSENDDRDVPFF